MEQEGHNDYIVQLLYLTSLKNNPSSCIFEYVLGPFRHHHLQGRKVSYSFMILKPMHETTENHESSDKYAYGLPLKSKAGELSFIISILSTFRKVAPL